MMPAFGQTSVEFHGLVKPKKKDAPYFEASFLGLIQETVVMLIRTDDSGNSRILL